LITDTYSGEGAADYVRRYGATFGSAANDMDNSAGALAVANSGLFYANPWIGVIRASDMRLVQHDAEWGNFDVYSIAQNLASE
jgi:hypothetical protein